MKNFIVFVLGIMACNTAFAWQSLVTSEIELNVTTGSVKMINENMNRNYLLLQNKGLSGVYIKFGSVQTSPTDGFILRAGGSYEPQVAPRNSLYMFSDGTPDTVIAVEGSN